MVAPGEIGHQNEAGEIEMVHHSKKTITNQEKHWRATTLLMNELTISSYYMETRLHKWNNKVLWNTLEWIFINWRLHGTAIGSIKITIQIKQWYSIKVQTGLKLWQVTKHSDFKSSKNEACSSMISQEWGDYCKKIQITEIMKIMRNYREWGKEQFWYKSIDHSWQCKF